MGICAKLATEPVSPTAIVACLDDSDSALEVAEAARQFAEAFGAGLTLFHVIEPATSFLFHPDPVETEFQHHQALRRLQRMLDGTLKGVAAPTVRLGEGDPVSEICRLSAEPGVILVLGKSGSLPNTSACCALLDRIVEQAPGPVLLVPTGQAGARSPINRIMVPLDGSCFGEAALASACQIAHHTGAEVVLVHVIPEAALTQIGPLGPLDLKLRAQLVERNERVGRAYLERQRRHLVDHGVSARTICLSGDVRTVLARVCRETGSDLTILSARGQSARRGVELAIGSVASYLASTTTRPLLVLRPVAGNPPPSEVGFQHQPLRMQLG